MYGYGCCTPNYGNYGGNSYGGAGWLWIVLIIFIILFLFCGNGWNNGSNNNGCNRCN